MATAKIVYASLTGNTEELADIVEEALENLGIDAEMVDCAQASPEIFEDVDIAIVGTYTYSDGSLPDEIMDFYEELGDLDLTGKIYGVFGSGDTFYDEYCKCVDDFDLKFAETGATKGAENVKVDLGAEEEDIQNLETFAKSLVGKLD